MEVVHERCAGLDVHKDTVVACLRLAKQGRVEREVRTFGTMTSALEGLARWLEEHGCTHAVMESTGVYWKPVWHALEGTVELVLANASHVRNVPGRKSDVSDAEWLVDLLAHGLLRGSFVPPRPIQELRDLTRTRKQLVREVVQHTQRIQKVLEDANIKLASAVSDVMGTSGRSMLRAIIDGQDDPEVLATLAHPRLQTPRPTLVEALRGQVSEHHRFLLRLHLEQAESLERAIERIEAEIEEHLRPFRAAADRLSEIPGVSAVSAPVIVSEIGVDMGRFPTVGHLISWAGLCPRLDQSAGKRRSTRLRKGAPWLKTVLVQCAWSAVRKRDSYLRAQFQRIKARRGPKKAIMAVAASILTAAYHMLRDDVPYQDLGANYFVRRDRTRTAQRLRRRLQDLGYEVEIRDAA